MKKVKKNIKFKRNIFNKKKLKLWSFLVKKQFSFKCVGCGYTKVLHSHHIIKKSKFPKEAYNVYNGVCLCYICHFSSNGVHGRGKPRNKIIKELRSLMKKGSISDAKNFVLKYKTKIIRKANLKK